MRITIIVYLLYLRNDINPYHSGMFVNVFNEPVKVPDVNRDVMWRNGTHINFVQPYAINHISL